MEIMANTSNHNQNHHQHQQQQELGLLVAIPKRQQQQQQQQQQEHYSHHYNSEATGSDAVVVDSHLPFQREVREWQRIDPDTGALLSGRLEADRWINGPLNSYGKKSSSTLSTTASQTLYVNTMSSRSALTNTYKSGVNKISLHAIVGSGSGSSSSTSSSINKLSTVKQQQHQPTLFSRNNDNISIIKNSHNSINNENSNQSHLLKTRVGANINCNFDDGDEYQTSAKTTKTTTATTTTPSTTVTVTLETRHHQHHHNDRLTPTQSIAVHSQHKRDEENFRHYVNSDVPFNEQDANDLRLSSRQLRRQQIPLNSSLQRSYSISTDDLSSEWNVDGYADEISKEEPAEWRRVSKLRRSFQSSNKTNESLKSPASLRKPLDLPENSVSVSKIKADLENGRRLSTVMRNNRLDLTALNTILQSDEINAKEEYKAHTIKKSSFLTAESLQEIRNKLKKLSDESLYKEDFKIHQTQQEKHENERTFNQEISERFKLFSDNKQANLTFVNISGKHASNSLESRVKYKDPNSTEWHLRRKSYGFEKMSPPEYKAMFCLDDSTDSGLGRSGELSNWSPTSDTSSKTNNRNSTIIHFEETARSRTDSNLTRGYLAQKPFEDERQISPIDKQFDMNRHLIAIDDTHYALDNPRQTTQIHLNGIYEDNNEALHATSQKNQQKRVEFCKTEVHFATESGRVNIVETDSKPPPTNNFRRRRRSSSVGPLQSLVKSVSAVNTSCSTITTAMGTVAVPITLFGEPNLKRAIINTASTAHRIPLESSPEPKTDSAMTHVTITVPSKNDLLPNYSSTSGIDTADCDTDEFISLRGILKNKPVKPKPYVLGENIENSKALWNMHNKLEIADKDSKQCSPPPSFLKSQKTVAERVRLVEQQQQQDTGPKCSSPSNGFSTKINVNLGDHCTSWQETDLPISNVVSIKFHSPQMKREIDSTKTMQMKSQEAKPRHLSNNHETSASTLKQTHRQTIDTVKDTLKIVKEARGARQLREHELSYFGVSKDKNNVQPLKTKLYSTPSLSVSTKRTLPSRRFSEATALKDKEWPNEDEKPDLLKHSEIQMQKVKNAPKASERLSSLATGNDLNSDEEHLYENIANEITPIFKMQSPSLSGAYNRKADLQRDAMILKEMNTNADQTLKDLSEETILRDRRRRSMQRRNSKPLETIEEKCAPEKTVESPAMPVKVDRATYSSEAKRIARRTANSPTPLKQRERTSSQSSVECCPRARSRSLSSEKEFETLKIKQARNSAGVKHKSYKTANARSCSRESQNSSHSQCSSTDEPLFDSIRHEERSRTKIKRHSNSSTKALRQSSNQSDQKEEAKRLSGTARSSTYRERVRCKIETDAKPSQRQHETNPSLYRATNSSGESVRRRRDESKDSQQNVKYCDITTGSISTKNNKHSLKYEDNKKTTVQEVSSFKNVEQSTEDKEQHIRSKAHSNRSTSRPRRHQHPEAQPKQQTIRERDQLKSRTTKASTAAINENTTPSKNANVTLLNGSQVPNHHYLHHHHHHRQLRSRSPYKDGHQSNNKRIVNENAKEHIYDLKTAFIKSTATKHSNKTKK